MELSDRSLNKKRTKSHEKAKSVKQKKIKPSFMNNYKVQDHQVKDPKFLKSEQMVKITASDVGTSKPESQL